MVDADEGTGFRVNIAAAGIRNPVELTLTAGSEEQRLAVTEDGTLHFPRRLADGASFAIAVAKTQQCVVPASGAIAGADATLDLICDGVTELSSVTFDTAVRLTPRFFDPRVTSYTGFEPFLLDTGAPVTMSATKADASAVVSPSLPITVAADADLAVSVARDPLSARTYSFTLSRKLLQESYVKAPQALAAPNFGGFIFAGGTLVGIAPTGVAISKETLVVGAPTASQAFVFVRAGSMWTHQATFSVPGARLGQAVAIDGDTLVLGAPAANAGVGAAFLAHRTNGVWSALQPLVAQPAPGVDAHYGGAVAIAGAYLVIGAPDGVTSPHPGAVHVFHDPGSGFVYERTLADGTDANFGCAVGMSGTTVAIGAPFDQTGRGGVYVYDAASGQRAFSGFGGAAGDHLGFAVDIDNDLMVAGAPDASSAAGRVQVFRFATAWASEIVLAPTPTPPTDAAFGAAVAVDRGHVIVGARIEDCGGRGVLPATCAGSAANAGAAYTFRKLGATWTQDAYIKSSNADPADQFGTSVAVDGDTFVVSAGREASAATGVDGDQSNNGATDSGAVYVFR